jgi:hypothetical protein
VTSEICAWFASVIQRASASGYATTAWMCALRSTPIKRSLGSYSTKPTPFGATRDANANKAEAANGLETRGMLKEKQKN